jgi:hypothetical protein
MKQAKASYNKMSGGMTLKEFGLEKWNEMSQKKKDKAIKDANQLKEIAGFGVFDMLDNKYQSDNFIARPAVMPNKNYPRGEGVKKRGRPRKMQGGMTIKDWGLEQYDRIPDAYKPGIESIAEAAYHQAGFGLKKKRGRPRKMKGGDIFSDIGNAFDPNKNGVAEAFRPGGPAEDFGKQIASELIHKGIPITASTVAAAAATALQPGNPLSPMLAGYAGEKAGEALAGYIGDQTGYGIVSDAMAYAKKKGKAAAQKVAVHLQKLAKQKTNELLDQGLERSTQYIEGLGLKKRRGRKKKLSGSALMAAGY